MKKICTICAYVIMGLFNTWLALYITSRLNFSFLPSLVKGSGGCNEIDHCDVSIWRYLLLLGLLFLPTLVHAIVGYKITITSSQRFNRHIVVVVMLLILTLIFYAGMRALHGV